MTPREGKAAVRIGPATTAGVLELPRSAPVADNGQPRNWEEFFRHMSPRQQEELLSLAGRQGILYAHQLPAPTNGKAPVDQFGSWNRLNQLLTGHARDLTPVPEKELTFVDADLDAVQRQAVARALATPDVALIAGCPGTGKSRVVGEILTQAAQRGQRVLFLAPSAAAIDHVLPRLAQRDALCPLRLQESQETVEALSPALRSMTMGQRCQALKEQTLERARLGLQSAEARCQLRRQEEGFWPTLQGLAEQAEGLRRQQQDLINKKQQIPEMAAKVIAALQAGEIPEAYGQHRQTLQDARDALQKKKDQQASAEKNRDQAAKDLAGLDTQLTALRPFAEAKRLGRWWTWTWWRAVFRGDVLGQYAALENQQRQTQQALGTAAEESQRFVGDIRQLEESLQALYANLQAAELESRQTELAAQEAPLEQSMRQNEDQWDQLTATLDAPLRPQQMTEPGLDAARLAWQTQVHQDEENCRFAHQWTAYLQEASGTLTERLLSLVNVVAGTIAAFCQDKLFGPSSSTIFDLLVLEEADQLTEGEFLKLSRRARRWVLVGEPVWDHAAPPVKTEPRPAVASSSILQKLWHQLHWDPRQLPFRWTWESDRLCCQLRTVPADQRRWLEMERVADSPEIELRILSLPRTAPVLAEVLFPSGATLAQAKGFIYREMQEVPVQTTGRCANLEENDEHIIFALADATTATPVALDHGIHEWLAAEDHGAGNYNTLHPSCWTCRLTFAKAAGWTRETVTQWAAQHLQHRDWGRTTYLQVPHRMEPSLANFLSELLYAGANDRQIKPGSNGQPAVVFIPVPSLRKDDSRPDKGKQLAKPANSLPREGAGLEQDLAASRHGDRLPNDLRPHLPAKGVVNFLEAQAVVRNLEEWAANNSRETLAVLAFSAAQVELIRLLVRRSTLLSGLGHRLEIGLPTAFGHREFAQVLVSLTRSHNHRAVSFGDNPAHLGLALTRARRQLILFGDPGTLVRRGQWQGRVEPLDDAASAREARLIGNLVRYLQDQHAHLSDGLPVNPR